MKTYDPKKIIIIFGARQFTGMSEDSIVSIAPNGDGLQTYVGADGDVARSLDPDATYEVTVSLNTTSNSNDYLSNMYNYDRETGDGIAPLLIKDLAGTTLFSAPEAWVANMPEASRGLTVDTQEWVFRTGQVEDAVIGGLV
jgi:hypothetical protein